MNDTNKQLAFYVVAGLAVIGFAGCAIIVVVKPESSEAIMKLFLEVLLIIGGFGGLSALSVKQSTKIAEQGEVLDKVQKQTNGTLTARDAEIALLRGTLAEHAPDALVQIDSGVTKTAEE